MPERKQRNCFDTTWWNPYVENIEDEVIKEKEHLKALNTEKELARRDELTGTRNKTAFSELEQSIQENINNGMTYLPFAIAVCDLNNLKKINDTDGHDAGDKAILAVSESAFEVLPMKCRFYRMGGDEFEILYPGASYTDVELVTNKFKDAVAKKGYSIAVGFGEFKKGMNFDNVFREVDAIMYEDKAHIKALKLAE
jgi:diguanylate cyclase (GGDEF)-like protein